VFICMHVCMLSRVSIHHQLARQQSRRIAEVEKVLYSPRLYALISHDCVVFDSSLVKEFCSITLVIGEQQQQQQTHKGI
jgi:hypothetical protein